MKLKRIEVINYCRNVNNTIKQINWIFEKHQFNGIEYNKKEVHGTVINQKIILISQSSINCLIEMVHNDI